MNDSCDPETDINKAKCRKCKQPATEFILGQSYWPVCDSWVCRVVMNNIISHALDAQEAYP